MASEKVLESKKAVVAGLVERLQAAQAGVIADYRGLTVAEDTELRNQLRQAGVEYCVLKNTMINLATKEMGFDQLASHLEGPTAVAFGYEDMIAPAKILSDFSKAKKKMTIKCGICDGAYLDQAGVAALANLPSKEVLIAKIMGSTTVLLDGGEGTARETKRRLALTGLLREGEGSITFRSSANEDTMTALAKRLLGD